MARKEEMVYVRIDGELKDALVLAVKSSKKYKGMSEFIRGLLEVELLPAGEKRMPLAFEREMYAIWDEVMPEGIARPKQGSKARLASMRARYKKEKNPTAWRWGMKALALSEWHMGKNQRSWMATMDYFLRVSKFPAWVEAGEMLRAVTRRSEEFSSQMAQAATELVPEAEVEAPGEPLPEGQFFL